ncbi:MAG TPA: LysR family transcriptional regulator [Candidatus Brevibacterium intestinigallinarum]|nr:LysR family transcriptional regulator [Candidatus Brevibacterium intestinigallinarum]
MWDLQRLRIWRAVVSTGSVSAAARNLDFAPASVSQQIIALQRAVGVPLYRRAGRGIEITEAGRRFAEESESLFAESARLDRVVDRLRAPAAARVVLACPSSVAKEWIPAVLSETTARHPGLRFDILTNEPVRRTDGPAPHIDISVRAGGDDTPVPASGAPGGTAHRRGLAPADGEVLAEDAYQLVVRDDHPVAGRHEVRVAELADLPLLDLDVEGSISGDVMDEAARAAGITPQHVARADDHYGLLAMVMAGVGVAPLPRLAALDLPAGLTAVSLVDPVPRRSIVLRCDDAVRHLPHIADIRAELVRAARRSAPRPSVER